MAAERMIKHSVHGSKWLPPHAILLIPGEINSTGSTIGTKVTGQAADIDLRVKTYPEIRFNPDYMAPVTSLYPNGKRPLDLHA